jgi:hypothetical protein
MDSDVRFGVGSFKSSGVVRMADAQVRKFVSLRQNLELRRWSKNDHPSEKLGG